MTEPLDRAWRLLWARELGQVERRKEALRQALSGKVRGLWVEITSRLPAPEPLPLSLDARQRARALTELTQQAVSELLEPIHFALAEEAERLSAFATTTEVCGAASALVADLQSFAQDARGPRREGEVARLATALGASSVASALLRQRPMPALPDPVEVLEQQIDLAFLPLTEVLDRHLAAEVLRG